MSEALLALNWPAILTAALAAFLVGGVWYSPALFGTAWMRETGLSEQQLSAANPARTYGVGLLLALLATAVFAAFLVLTPTLHPWYLTWIVPFLALRQSRAWIWLAAVAPLLYWPLEGWRTEAVWHEPLWLWPLVAVPFWALLLFPSGSEERVSP